MFWYLFFRYFETIINLIKAYSGSGMFAMGDAFKNAGLLLGPLLTIFIGIICFYGNHILVSDFLPCHLNF